ncbi:hypothetical protein HPP92_010812 [Vanilla planifolia]|uniref:BHLH domain-containing protein n=1 Tax=Vanilla planifolia TaxID=51239 RepID=A0A835R0R7_VANPL|nr:hypothetical protein HPP92_010812 [Vanilla planifolia]
MDGCGGGGPSCSTAVQEQISFVFGGQVPLSSASFPAGASGSFSPHVPSSVGGKRANDADSSRICALVEDGQAESKQPGKRKYPMGVIGAHSDEKLHGGTSKAVAPPRTSSGSKRSRAAEVHNLSEKRRRSRINEKMKALQNLIPNSNKTDKASMLDEAIEYLKQLQLQVQMLSMRNGLSLQPMYLPSMLQSQHASQICLGFSGDERATMNLCPRILPLNQETLGRSSLDPQSQQGSSHQSVLQSVTSFPPPESLQPHQGTLQLPTPAEILAEEMVSQQQQQLDAAITDGMKTLGQQFAGEEPSFLDDRRQLSSCISGRDGLLMRWVSREPSRFKPPV